MAYQPTTPFPVLQHTLAEGREALARVVEGRPDTPAELAAFVAEAQWVWRLVTERPTPLPTATEARAGLVDGAARITGEPLAPILDLLDARLDDLVEAADHGPSEEPTIPTPSGPRSVGVLVARVAVGAHVAATRLDPVHRPSNPAAVLALARAVEVAARGPFPAVTARRLSLRQRRDPWATFVAETGR